MRSLRHESGELDLYNGPRFTLDLLDTFSTFKRLGYLGLTLVAPWYTYGKAKAQLTGSRAWPSMIVMAIMFYGFITLCICELAVDGLFYVGWAVYMFFALYITGIRSSARLEYEINGNIIEDFFACLMLYPFAGVQLYTHVKDYDFSKKTDVPMNEIKYIEKEYENGSYNPNVRKIMDPAPPYVEPYSGADNIGYSTDISFHSDSGAGSRNSTQL